MQSLDLRIFLRLLAFGLQALCLQPLRDVLIDGCHSPDITASHFDRWREFPTLDHIVDGLIAAIE
jgi:hypothetical protein